MSVQNSKPDVFDVFLCHNNEDKPAVREIANRLVAAGIKPWLDEKEIRPGTSFQKSIGRQIETIKSAAVFVGENGFGPWQDQETQALLSQLVKRECPIIPAILPSARTTPELPWTLANLNWVDFRLLEPDPIQQLIWGITGEKPKQRQSFLPDSNAQSEPRFKYHESRLYPPLAEPPNQEDRTQLEILRRRVVEYWIDGVLRHSLYKEVSISLEKREVDDFVDAPWKYAFEPSDVRCPVVLDRSTTGAYDSAGLLLIVGEPGSGKTTTLLELARTLLSRAAADLKERVAVVLNLSSWKNKQPIREWICVELWDKYRIPRTIGTSWLQNDYLIPLLDGLDEVLPSAQIHCVSAINAFIEESSPSGLVICCRMNEYQWLPRRLKLNAALSIQSLSPEEVTNYLSGFGQKLAPLKQAIEADPALAELAETPVMLNIMTLALQGVKDSDLVRHTDNYIEDLRKQVFCLFVERMFLLKGGAPEDFPKGKTIAGLCWLARKMKTNSQSLFLLETLQPSWLSTRGELVAYGAAVALTLGVMFAVGGALLGMAISLPGPSFFCTYFGISTFLGVGLGSWSRSRWRNGIIGGSIGGLVAPLVGFFPASFDIHSYLEWASVAWLLLVGLLAGLSVGAIVGLGVGCLTRISLIEKMSWRWNRFSKGAIPGIIVGFCAWLPLAFGAVLFNDAKSSQDPGNIGASFKELLLSGLNVGIFGGLLGGLVSGFSEKVRHDKLIANQGIRLSARNCLLVFLASWPLLGCAGIWGWQPFSAFMIALNLAFMAALNRGGSAVIKHYTLRLFLWLRAEMPINYVKFLDHGAKLIFLKKVGGGYIFIHRMLLEYFAEMNPRPTKG